MTDASAITKDELEEFWRVAGLWRDGASTHDGAVEALLNVEKYVNALLATRAATARESVGKLDAGWALVQQLTSGEGWQDNGPFRRSKSGKHWVNSLPVEQHCHADVWLTKDGPVYQCGIGGPFKLTSANIETVATEIQRWLGCAPEARN